MKVVETKGNMDLMNREKTLFLCSKRTPIGLYEYIFRWTDSLGERDCIACFNSTEMESEVLKALLVSRIPVILFVMNRFADVNNIQIERALQEQRMLIVVLRRDEPKGSGQTPRLRNEFVLSLCQRVVCGYVNKNGSVFSLLAGQHHVERLIADNSPLMVEEPDARCNRWTVAEDKVLLRMYYADMGIHAIHQQLRRSYLAIYVRIRSITQPEDLLKGREFEDFVLGMFDVRDGGPLVLQEWQGDKSLGKVRPENNGNPDFVFRYDDDEFAVECKWRERFDNDICKRLFPANSIRRYQAFEASRGVPVTIIIGVGGEPCNPESIYVVPLQSVEALTAHARPLADFLYSESFFDAACFIRQKGAGAGCR